MIQILHNSRCGKSRLALSVLEEKMLKYEIINYLVHPPTPKELILLLQKLNFKPIELVRQKEKVWIENFKNKSLTDDDIILALAKNPILIERPILIHGDKAIVARDLDFINAFLK